MLSWAVPQPLGSSDIDWEVLGCCHSSQRASSSGRVKKAGSMTSLPVCYGASGSPKTWRVVSLELGWLLVCSVPRLINVDIALIEQNHPSTEL